MKELISFLVSLIVDHPKDISIEERSSGENSIQYIIKSNPEDTGKIIGKAGKIIQALRNVCKVLAVKEGKQIRIEVG